ncbi:hypothetical protein Mame01_59720 [Microbispora amethystogenes]|nr:hypothetical protein Mame01_59720 [Microbispora amethystogenes]
MPVTAAEGTARAEPDDGPVDVAADVAADSAAGDDPGPVPHAAARNPSVASTGASTAGGRRRIRPGADGAPEGDVPATGVRQRMRPGAGGEPDWGASRRAPLRDR